MLGATREELGRCRKRLPAHFNRFVHPRPFPPDANELSRRIAFSVLPPNQATQRNRHTGSVGSSVWILALKLQSQPFSRSYWSILPTSLIHISPLSRAVLARGPVAVVGTAPAETFNSDVAIVHGSSLVHRAAAKVQLLFRFETRVSPDDRIPHSAVSVPCGNR